MAITVGEHYHFLFGTEAQYKALQTAGSISANDLYFITDTKQLYVGEDLYTGQVKFVDSFPASPSQGIIYVNGATHETKVYAGTEWKTIVPPISTTLDEATVATNLVTAKAIRDFVKGLNDVAVKDVDYSEATQKFTVTYGNGTTSELALKNLITGASYDSTNGDFTFTVANGESIVVNTPKENFLSTASYDGDTHMLTMTLVDGTEVEVDLADLIDTYTVKSSATVELSMTGNEITASVKKSAQAKNALVLNDDGLFVPEALVKSISNTATANLSVSAEGQLTATVNISAVEGNKVVAKEDGIFVAETDLSDYYNKTEVNVELNKKADKATTLAGYGITDAYTKTEVDTELAKKADKTTTLAGYGITDAYTKAEVDAFTTWKAMA